MLFYFPVAVACLRPHQSAAVDHFHPDCVIHHCDNVVVDSGCVNGCVQEQTQQLLTPCLFSVLLDESARDKSAAVRDGDYEGEARTLLSGANDDRVFSANQDNSVLLHSESTNRAVVKYTPTFQDHLVNTSLRIMYQSYFELVATLLLALHCKGEKFSATEYSAMFPWVS